MKVTYICRSPAKKVVTYFILFLLSGLITNVFLSSVFFPFPQLFSLIFSPVTAIGGASKSWGAATHPAAFP
jgi:hypothetical protein